MSKRPIVHYSITSPSTSSDSNESSKKDIHNISTSFKKIDTTNEIEKIKIKRKLPPVRSFPSSYEAAVLYNSIEQSNYKEIKKEEIKKEEIKKDEKKKIKKCLGRVTNDAVFEYFGDRRHKFYIEFRCNYPCFENREVCIKCLQKKSMCVIQTSRLFNHGMIYEAIPDQSHIFGGKWYQENIIKWGPPPSEIIEYALEHQCEARGNYEVIQPIYEYPISKAKQLFNSQEMPRGKKAIASSVDEKQEEIPKVKRGRKPKIMSIQDLPSITESTLPESDPTKCIPKVTKRATSSPEKQQAPAKPRKRIVRKKSEPTPYESLVQTQPLIYKDVSIPTHMEESLEEFDADDYEIEYVKISTFVLGSTTYFRDSIKNKVYRKIKEKNAGEYIGRYDPESETIMSDIPDSDDESEE